MSGDRDKNKLCQKPWGDADIESAEYDRQLFRIRIKSAELLVKTKMFSQIERTMFKDGLGVQGRSICLFFLH